MLVGQVVQHCIGAHLGNHLACPFCSRPCDKVVHKIYFGQSHRYFLFRKVTALYAVDGFHWGRPVLEFGFCRASVNWRFAVHYGHNLAHCLKSEPSVANILVQH
jgi:hypothetical protein